MTSLATVVTEPVGAQQFLASERLATLAQRLRAASDVLLGAVPEPAGDDARDASQLLPLLAEAVRTARPAELWLVVTAVVGAYPTAQELAWIRRAVELAPDRTSVETLLLEHGRTVARARRLAPLPMDVVTGAVLVDADYSAKNDKQTGIQRVTRHVCGLWTRARDVQFVVWADEHAGYRRLTHDETRRLLRGADPSTGLEEEEPEVPTPRLCVPWRSTLVLTEVPPQGGTPALAALAESSGTAVVAIGYDAIPITSIDMRPLADATTFVRYLSMLKHARRIAAISSSSFAEFAGFSSALAAQGLAGPEVVEVRLATDVPPVQPMPAPERPVVLCLGSHEPHKNHLAVLHVAEALWRDGLDFELHFVGGPGWDVRAYDEAVARLTREGWPLVDHGMLPDDELWSLVAGATITVFPSLHEGFGLPVAESLSCGTPVITTDYGSTAEIAESGGCVLVDPRSDAALEAALRHVLTDSAFHGQLRDEARGYRPKSWATYADELWDALVPEAGR